MNETRIYRKTKLVMQGPVMAADIDTRMKKTAWTTMEDDIESGYKPAVRTEFQRLEVFLHSIQLPMAICGFFNLRKHKPNSSDDEPDADTNRSQLPSKQTIYNVTMLLILWAMFIRVIAAFFLGNQSDYITIMRFIPLGWYFQCAMNATIMVKASHTRFGHMDKACKIWSDKVMTTITDLNIQVNTNKLRRTLLVVLIAGWMCIAINIISTVVIIFFPDSFSFGDVYQELYIVPLPVNIWTKGIISFLLIFLSAAWMLPIMYVITMATVCKCTFLVCTEALRVVVEEKDAMKANEFPRCLRKIRMLHLNICKAVGEVDKDFGYLFANSFATQLPLNCFLLYQLLKTDNNMMMTIAYVYWLIIVSLMLICVTRFAAELNKAAHSPLEYIYDTSMQGASTEQIGQVQLFLSKLTGPQIGFTIMEFVTITKEFLLTLVGLYVTYFFVLMQF